MSIVPILAKNKKIIRLPLMNITHRCIYMANNIYRTTLLFLLLSISSLSIAQDNDTFDKANPYFNKDLISGPEVGQSIPDFQGLDQHGKLRSFDDIKGPKGAYVLFHRSADW